jgi:hypothetical protein
VRRVRVASVGSEVLSADASAVGARSCMLDYVSQVERILALRQVQFVSKLGLCVLYPPRESKSAVSPRRDGGQSACEGRTLDGRVVAFCDG